MIPAEFAERHRAIAAHFTDLANSVDDWSAATPVPEWAAADIVAHLVNWSTGFLSSGGIDLAANRASDPAERWRVHAAAMQGLLDGPDSGQELTHPMTGTQPLGAAIDRFYTSDVFMHTWDLGRASGRPIELDADEAERLLNGMLAMEPMLRQSGQFGERQPVGEDAAPGDRLMAFIGRDVIG